MLNAEIPSNDTAQRRRGMRTRREPYSSRVVAPKTVAHRERQSSSTQAANAWHSPEAQQQLSNYALHLGRRHGSAAGRRVGPTVGAVIGAALKRARSVGGRTG